MSSQNVFPRYFKERIATIVKMLVDEVPTIKVTYEKNESIPAPSKINDCEIIYNYNYNGAAGVENCMKYYDPELLVSQNVFERVEQITPVDLNQCTGLIHNGSISLRERDMIYLNFSLDSTKLNILVPFDSEYLKYTDQPPYIDSLNLENSYFMSHFSNATMSYFSRYKRQLMDSTLLTQVGFSPNYKSYHYIDVTYQTTPNNTYTIMKFKPKTTLLQVEIEQK
ncbi:15746_t:CDS:2 [Dentiscutata erythropus]|uniref:15746_t:CDS:1 n=1 Tax=Dentiscutata erythropus TaxID=1348616 RepID=A0A9N9CTH2_9GLOM|nr:15746_t:CDS:2 [Dentiscutata erythropus]